MSLAVVEPLLTNADLENLPDNSKRYELIGGQLIVAAAPDLVHQRISGRTHYAFFNFLLANPIGEIILTPGVIFSDFDGVIPDLVYLSNERRDQIAAGSRIYGAPELVIEILSPGNAMRDRREKLQLYNRFGVVEYWIIVPRERAVEVYRRTDGALRLFTTYAGDEAITTPLLPGFSCPASSLF
jgi:Uma2 family endonuclease